MNSFHEEQFVQRYTKYVHNSVIYKGAKREETAKERNVKIDTAYSMIVLL